MVELDIDEEQAKAQIEACEAELKGLKSQGAENPDAELSLKLALSFFKVGLFAKAFLSAVRARRLIAERNIRKG